MTDFQKIYKTCFQHECPPSEGNKKKAEGCFNAVNDYGAQPQEEACMGCWKDAIFAALYPPEGGGDEQHPI